MGEVHELFGSDDAMSLADIEAALERMPPEVLIAGPPPDGELLLRRTLRRLRVERTADLPS